MEMVKSVKYLAFDSLFEVTNVKDVVVRGEFIIKKQTFDQIQTLVCKYNNIIWYYRQTSRQENS